MSRIGTNIRAIREAYGETQLDLAQQLGFDSSATISMIESGARGQKRFDLLEKIARHYWISESALFYQDWGENDNACPDFLSFPVDDKKQIHALFAGTLPVLQSSIALQGAAFRNAFALHQEAVSEIVDTLTFPSHAFTKCISLYEISLKETHLPEAAANILWWLLVSGLFHCYPRTFLGLQRLNRKAITKQEFFRDWYLAGCEMEDIEQEKSLKASFRKQHRKQIHDLLCLLYSSPSGIIPAEYYKSLLLYFGLDGTGFRTGECRLIGSAMLSALSEIGNPYAVSFLETQAKFHNV